MDTLVSPPTVRRSPAKYMAHSLEIRTPFVDISLLQTLAPWLAAHPGLTKSGIAAAIAPQLPAELLNKPKTGFSIPVRD